MKTKKEKINEELSKAMMRIAEKVTSPSHLHALIEIGKKGQSIEKLFSNPTEKESTPKIIPLLAYFKTQTMSFKSDIIPLCMGYTNPDDGMKLYLNSVETLISEFRRELTVNIDCLGNAAFKKHMKEIYRLIVTETDYNVYAKACVAAVRKNGTEIPFDDEDDNDDGPRVG